MTAGQGCVHFNGETNEPVMSLPYELGAVVAGKYHLATLLGEGGMGVVYGACDSTGQYWVALKLLHPKFAADELVLARFAREAMLCSQMHSRHVARIYDVGKTEEGLPYIAMEYLVGADLSAMLVEYGPLPYADVADYLIQACHAVALAHTQEIVHRDLKPSNMFLAATHEGSYIIKVLDFGVSKVRSAGGSKALTQAGDYCGSPLYMAPEQAKSARTVGPKADVWSLGMSAYELLTGFNPVERDNFVKTYLALMAGEIPPLHEQVEVPDGLSEVVHRCLQNNPDDRYKTVAGLAMDLASFALR